MKIPEYKKKEILNFLTTITQIIPTTKMRGVAKLDREKGVIYINSNVVGSLPDLLYVIGHEVAHEVWDQDNEHICDEIGLSLANQNFFKEYIKVLYPIIYNEYFKRRLKK